MQKVKLIIEIPKEAKQAFDNAESNDLKGGYYDHGGIIGKAIQNGIPLDDVIGKIDKAYDDLDGYDPYALGTFANRVSDILDNISKGSEVKPNDSKGT